MRIRGAIGAAVLVAAIVGGPGSSPTAAQETCGWTGGGSGSVYFGEGGANYWLSFVSLPEGGYIEYRGEFPHARFMSFANYGGGTRSVGGIYDAQIVPDPGSVNPFLLGADRTATERSYTVRFVDGQAPPPSEREPNTFYRVKEDGSNSSNRRWPTVTLRVYAADQGLRPRGGVGLPRITVVRADGTREPLPACGDSDLALLTLGTEETVASSGIGGRWPEDAVPGDEDPPEWRKFTGYGSLVGDDDAAGEGGFGDNPHQKYMSTTFRRKFGDVLAFRAKGPT
ncbi:MAG: hypothetical protein ACREQY_11900, partial [Candidatus Binatia bacterium]